MKVVITGATGFIGRALVNYLVNNGISVVVIVRKNSVNFPSKVEQVAVSDLRAVLTYTQENIKVALQDADVVIHLAARAHVMKEVPKTALTEFSKDNRDVSIALAKMATVAGVKRFIFLSSIGVNGNNNASPFTEIDESNPQELYAISKCEAEQYLLALGQNTKMEIVIIRPPLVYGPNPPGNFASLIKWVNKGIPLPFGAIHNQRSFIALDNLVSFIAHCVTHPKAANEIFLISDGEDVSTTELLRKVAHAFGKKRLLIPIPVSWMNFVATSLGKLDVANRLFGSLQVNSSKARDLLGWKPVITMDEQLKKTADAYLNEKNL
ncbi:MAG: UDP-glucose 4-epimerase family protein [Methylophagaceae bacterium]